MVPRDTRVTLVFGLATPTSSRPLGTRSVRPAGYQIAQTFSCSVAHNRAWGTGMKMAIPSSLPMPWRFSPGCVPVPQAEALGHGWIFILGGAPDGHEKLR